MIQHQTFSLFFFFSNLLVGAILCTNDEVELRRAFCFESLSSRWNAIRILFLLLELHPTLFILHCLGRTSGVCSVRWNCEILDRKGLLCSRDSCEILINFCGVRCRCDIDIYWKFTKGDGIRFHSSWCSGIALMLKCTQPNISYIIENASELPAIFVETLDKIFQAELIYCAREKPTTRDRWLLEGAKSSQIEQGLQFILIIITILRCREWQNVTSYVALLEELKPLLQSYQSRATAISIRFDIEFYILLFWVTMTNFTSIRDASATHFSNQRF